MIKHEITYQGAVQINHAYIYQFSENVCAIGVDMKTKRADVFSTGCDLNNAPTVALETNDESLYLNTDVDRETPTEICFPDFKGWNVWSVSVSKYTAYVCLVKENTTI